jgi:hypothetical protein
MGRFFAALRYFFTLSFLRRSEDIRRAAEEQFTGSPAGIRAGFAVHRDKLADDYRETEAAVSQVEMILSDTEDRLKRLVTEEESLKARKNGAVAAAAAAMARAKAAGAADPAKDQEVLDAEAAYARFDEQLRENQQGQQDARALLAAQRPAMDDHLRRLTAMKAELDRLPLQEAEAVARFVSTQKILELNHRLMNAQNALDASPVAAILESVRRQEAQAQLSQRMVGADARVQDAKYEALGRDSAATDTFAALVAARVAEQDAGKSEAAPADREGGEASSERPQL